MCLAALHAPSTGNGAEVCGRPNSLRIASASSSGLVSNGRHADAHTVAGKSGCNELLLEVLVVESLADDEVPWSSGPESESALLKAGADRVIGLCPRTPTAPLASRDERSEERWMRCRSAVWHEDHPITRHHERVQP